MKRLCVSACLLGVPCRWKGDAKPCEAVQRLAERAAYRVSLLRAIHGKAKLRDARHYRKARKMPLQKMLVA